MKKHGDTIIALALFLTFLTYCIYHMVQVDKLLMP
jgi:hypothetical protein